MAKCHVILYRGNDLLAKAIKWQTRSEYCHAAVATQDRIYEATGKKNVVRRRMIKREDYEQGDWFAIEVPDYEKMEAFLEAQLGKKYDYTMIARFLSRRQATRRSKNRWFCSELVFAALLRGGARLFERIEPWQVSPGMLSYSTKLEP